MKKKNNILKWAVVLIVLSLLPATVVINAEEEPLTYEEHIAILDTLPYFLEGTILDGSMRVIVTEDGTLPDFIDSSQYDLVISRDTRHQIIEDARDAFIAMYGIDPCPPEPPEEPWPYSYPHEMQSLAEISEFSDEISTFLTFEISEQLSEEVSTLTSTEILEISEFIHISDDYSQGFYQSDVLESGPIVDRGSPHVSPYDEMYLNLFVPTDSEHRPYYVDNMIDECSDGWKRFDTFNFDPRVQEMFGYWDASDVGTDTEDQLRDLEEDWPSFGYVHFDWVVHMGIVRRGNHNGMAWRDDFFSIVSDRVVGLNFGNDNTAQHELTHNLGDIPDDDGWWPWNHNWNTCVVNYFWMWIHNSPPWCSDCRNIINNEIW